MSGKTDIKPSLIISPLKVLVGEPLSIKISGLNPRRSIKIVARQEDDSGVLWESYAIFNADNDGTVDLDKHAPVSGTYDEADPSGLFWSMSPVSGKPYSALGSSIKPQTITISVEIDNKEVLSQDIERLSMLPGVERIPIREAEVIGTLFIPKAKDPQPAIITLGGSQGGVMESLTATFASLGYVALGLGYFGMENLPDSLVEIPVETVEKAIKFLEAHPRVKKDSIGIYGASKGVELALLAASKYKEIKAVVCNSPSGVVFEGIWEGMGRNPKSSWTYKGEPLPFVPLKFNISLFLSFEWAKITKGAWSTKPMYENALKNKEAVENATIEVENIKGPVLLISGSLDKVWPSGKLSEMIMERLKVHNHLYSNINLHYENTGHLIRSPYIPTTINYITLPGDMIEKLGGTPKEAAKAALDSWPKIKKFFEDNLK